MKKILLSVVAIATLTTGVFATCNETPNFIQYQVKDIKLFQHTNDKTSSVLSYATAQGIEDALIQKYGTLSTSKLKNVGVGVTASTSYKNIAYNYLSFQAKLNNEDIVKMVEFLGMHSPVVAYEHNNETHDFDLSSEEGFQKFNVFAYPLTTIDLMKENGGYLDAYIFISNFVLGNFHNSDVLSDPQLKQFVKAIIQGDNETALKTIRNAKFKFPAGAKKQYSDETIHEIINSYECQISKRGYSFYK